MINCKRARKLYIQEFKKKYPKMFEYIDLKIRDYINTFSEPCINIYYKHIPEEYTASIVYPENMLSNMANMLKCLGYDTELITEKSSFNVKKVGVKVNLFKIRDKTLDNLVSEKLERIYDRLYDIKNNTRKY